MLLFCYKVGYVTDLGGKKVVGKEPINSFSQKTYLGPEEIKTLDNSGLQYVDSTDKLARLEGLRRFSK